MFALARMTMAYDRAYRVHESKLSNFIVLLAKSTEICIRTRDYEFHIILFS